MKEKIAILADSGSDIYLDDKNVPLYTLPLRIIIDGVEYIDKKDITLNEVLDKLDSHKITTSLPSGEDILNTLNQIKKDGYTHVICIPISKGLSGTMNVIRNITESYEDLTIAIIDTKNISMASGYSSIQALELINEGKSFNEIVNKINEDLKLKKVFFTVDKLIYLKRGGRIGLVTATIADLLKIKPVISCNDDGVYYTVKKQRGYQRAVNQLIEFAADFIGDNDSYDITLLNSNSKLDLDLLTKQIKEKLPNINNFNITKVTPALAIHIGSEALGIAVSIRN